MWLGEDDRAKVQLRYLYCAYGIAAAAFAFGIWSGWFTARSPFTTEVMPGVVLALTFVTYLIRGPAAFQTPGYTGRRALIDLLKAVACWLAIFVWIAVAIRFVPDTRVGAAILVGPIIAGIVGGSLYFWRASRFVRGGFVRAISTARPIPSESVDQGSVSVLAADTSSDRIEVSVDFGEMALRFVLGVALMSLIWWVLGRDSALISTITAVGTASVAYMLGRALIGRGPAVVIGPTGISIRKGIGSGSNIRWTEVTGFELKSMSLSSILVINVRDPEQLIDRQSGYRRWAMRQGQQMFGSPAYISASMLKCDRSWLLRTATAYCAKYTVP